MSEFTPRERVTAALSGQPVAPVPVSAWSHFYTEEWDPERLAAATLESRERHSWDFVKLNPRATYFAEAFGNTYRRGQGPLDRPALVDAVLGDGAWPALAPVSGTAGVFAEQLRALRLVRQGLGPDVPLLATVFSPLTVLGYLVGHRPELVVSELRRMPVEVSAAAEVVASALRDYITACLEEGADGIFYAISGYAGGLIPAPEYRSSVMPLDLKLLGSARGAWFNVLHLCGDGVPLELADEYPVAAVNWAPSGSNPGIDAARALTRRALMGGVDHRAMVTESTPSILEMAQGAVRESGGRRFLLTPGCSVPPEAPPENVEVLSTGALAEAGARSQGAGLSS